MVTNNTNSVYILIVHAAYSNNKNMFPNHNDYKMFDSLKKSESVCFNTCDIKVFYDHLDVSPSSSQENMLIFTLSKIQNTCSRFLRWIERQHLISQKLVFFIVSYYAITVLAI